MHVSSRASSLRGRALLVTLLLSVLQAGCAARTPVPAPTPLSTGLTWGSVELLKVGTIQREGLDESSGVVRSLTRQDVFWTFQDSGNEATLYAMDSTGRDLGQAIVRNARNVDWEAIAAGPCGDDRCLYIGDTGDNLEFLPQRTIYRLRDPWPADREPVPDAAPATLEAGAEALSYRHEDRPRDVEAMVVSEDGGVQLFTKGRSGGVLQYRLPPDAWSARGRAIAVARRVDSLHLAPPTPADMVTGAALAPDGTLGVRTYRTLYLFRMDPRTGRLTSPAPFRACDLTAAREPQGEGIAWLGSGRWLLTSEQKGAPVVVVWCRD